VHINLTSKGPIRRQSMPDTLNSLKTTVRAKDKLINELNAKIAELEAPRLAEKEPAEEKSKKEKYPVINENATFPGE